jgi:hypothetical protein
MSLRTVKLSDIGVVKILLNICFIKCVPHFEIPIFTGLETRCDVYGNTNVNVNFTEMLPFPESLPLSEQNESGCEYRVAFCLSCPVLEENY